MDLSKYVKQVSQEDFGKPFQHDAIWNNRLQMTGGRFFPKDGHLDFNPKVLNRYGETIFRQVVRHELCHYHLYFDKKGYRHSDHDFNVLLSRVNGLRYVPLLKDGPKWRYRWQSCGYLYMRQRRINTTNRCCGKCRGRLTMESLI